MTNPLFPMSKHMYFFGKFISIAFTFFHKDVVMNFQQSVFWNGFYFFALKSVGDLILQKGICFFSIKNGIVKKTMRRYNLQKLQLGYRFKVILA